MEAKWQNIADTGGFIKPFETPSVAKSSPD
jgi:hypothetical protein